MKFWDASAVIPLLLAEPQRAALLGELERDPVMLVWWGTPVECVSAIARRERHESEQGGGRTHRYSEIVWM